MRTIGTCSVEMALVRAMDQALQDELGVVSTHIHQKVENAMPLLRMA